MLVDCKAWRSQVPRPPSGCSRRLPTSSCRARSSQAGRLGERGAKPRAPALARLGIGCAFGHPGPQLGQHRRSTLLATASVLNVTMTWFSKRRFRPLADQAPVLPNLHPQASTEAVVPRLIRQRTSLMSENRCRRPCMDPVFAVVETEMDDTDPDAPGQLFDHHLRLQMNKADSEAMAGILEPWVYPGKRDDKQR